MRLGAPIFETYTDPAPWITAGASVGATGQSIVRSSRTPTQARIRALRSSPMR